MSNLVLVIRKPLDDDDMQGWCEMLFDSPFLRGLTPDQLTELMLTLASEVGTFDLLEDLADTYVAIEHSTPVPTAQNLLDEMIRRHLASDGVFDDYIFDKHNGSTVLEIAEEWGLVIPERMKRPEGMTAWKRKAEEDALQQGELEVVAPEVVE